MKSILGRLQKARKPSNEESKGAYETAHNDMVERIRQEAMAEARATVKEEMYAEMNGVRETLNETRSAKREVEASLAKAEKKLAQGVTTLEEARAEALEARNETDQMKGSIEGHIRASENAESSAAFLESEYQNAVENFKAERKRTQGLELALANKSGQLDYIKEQPAPVLIPSQKVPAFTIENVMRGRNDRIISATITPVETE